MSSKAGQSLDQATAARLRWRPSPGGVFSRISSGVLAGLVTLISRGQREVVTAIQKEPDPSRGWGASEAIGIDQVRDGVLAVRDGHDLAVEFCDEHTAGGFGGPGVPDSGA